LTTALLGVKNEKQMEENVASLGWQPKPEQKEEIDRLFAKG
jgi:aryl-alcohol dehydrogenase-like predicted oxidoreductase